MVETDITAFATMLEDVWSLWPNAKPLTSGQATMFFRALAQYPLDAVRAGFDGHVKDKVRGRFAPVPADIIAAIEGIVADDGRPGPEEAWAIAVGAMDEKATMVWTTEIASAWGMAHSVMQLGDEVGARMTFRETYNRLVDAARANGRATNWTASLGFNGAERQDAIARATALGRLPPPQVPLLENEAPALDELKRRQPVTGLGQLLERAPAWVIERLNKTRETLTTKTGVDDRQAVLPPDVLRTRELQRQANESVDAALQKTGESVEQYLARHGRKAPSRGGDTS